MLLCSKCKVEKPKDSFSKRPERPRGYASWCKRCLANKRKKEYRDANKEGIKDQKLRHYFNISLVEYNEMLDHQDNKCAICNLPEAALGNNGLVKALAVDHCHETGQIRGLLCSKCNQGLGLFNEDATRLEAAITYLKEGV